MTEALRAFLRNETDPIFQADDPIMRVPVEASIGLGDLSTNHDGYLYRKDWQGDTTG
jgi:hypothetical protein